MVDQGGLDAFNNADTSTAKRKTHIFRIYKDDDKNSDVWVDVERLDAFIAQDKKGSKGRLLFFRFDWRIFDPRSTSGNIDVKYLYDPTSDSPGSADKLRMPLRKKVIVEAARGSHFITSFITFNNTSPSETRVVRRRRVFHYDIDASRLDANGQPPKDPDKYLALLSASKSDSSQYLDVEVLQKFYTEQGKGYAFLGRVWTYFLDKSKLLFDPPVAGGPTGTAAGGSFDPPWRLDPLQNIVNVSWGGGLAVEFGNKDQAPGVGT